MNTRQADPDNQIPRRDDFLAFFWAMPVVVLLIIGSTLAWFAFDERKQTLEQEFRFLEAHARIADAEIDKNLLVLDRLLQELIDGRLKTPTRTPAELEALHQDLFRHYPNINFFLITNRDGKIITANTRINPELAEKARGFDASGREYFRTHRDAAAGSAGSGSAISRPFKSTSGNINFVVSRAIRRADGQFEGVVAATLTPAFFDEIFGSIKPDEEGSIVTLINRDGDILYRVPDPKSVMGSSLKDSQRFIDFIQSGQRSFRVFGISSVTGEERVSLSRWVGSSSLGVIVSRRADNVFAEWKHNLIIHILIFIVTAGVILMLSLLVYRRSKALWQTNRRLEIDIAARERAEARLRLYGTVFENSGEGILISDQNNAILAVNAAFSKMTGYDREEIIGQNPRLLASGKTPRETYEEMWATLSQGDLWQGEVWDKCKDGTVFPKWLSVSVVKDDHGKVTHYVGSFIDTLSASRPKSA